MLRETPFGQCDDSSEDLPPSDEAVDAIMAAGPESSGRSDEHSIDLEVPSLPSPGDSVPGGNYIEFSCGLPASKVADSVETSSFELSLKIDNGSEFSTPASEKKVAPALGPLFDCVQDATCDVSGVPSPVFAKSSSDCFKVPSSVSAFQSLVSALVKADISTEAKAGSADSDNRGSQDGPTEGGLLDYMNF